MVALQHTAQPAAHMLELLGLKQVHRLPTEVCVLRQYGNSVEHFCLVICTRHFQCHLSTNTSMMLSVGPFVLPSQQSPGRKLLSVANVLCHGLMWVLWRDKGVCCTARQRLPGCPVMYISYSNVQFQGTHCVQCKLEMSFDKHKPAA